MITATTRPLTCAERLPEPGDTIVAACNLSHWEVCAVTIDGEDKDQGWFDAHYYDLGFPTLIYRSLLVNYVYVARADGGSVVVECGEQAKEQAK